MPHPEDATEKILGSEDGLKIFSSIISALGKPEKKVSAG
jgi:phosphoribosylformylglycinamidine (FGAM) synthase-like amidotransferase family enzyme